MLQKETNQGPRFRDKARTLTRALAEALVIVAAVSTADSDTGFGLDIRTVDVVCGIEKDDVGSVVKKTPKCAGFTYVQAPQQQ